MHRAFRLQRSAVTTWAAVAALSAATTGSADATGRTGSYPAAARAAAALPASGNMVVDWDRELVRIIGTPGAQPATIHPTRSLAIMHAAIYDAVVSIPHSGAPYLFSLTAPSGARPDAAAAEAGHDVLVALYPSWASAVDQQLAAELAAIPDGAAKQQGIAVGRLAAALMLAARANDGSAAKSPALPVGTQPGDYRPPAPTFAPAIFTQWPAVTPFVLRTADQFRSAPPPLLTSDAYFQAIDEVKSLGQKTSTTRTADQTIAAKFWSPAPWITWNGIAENAALAHHIDLGQTARLFALLNLSLADTTIALYDAKYHYRFWRPITAIRAGGDPGWTPLNMTTPDPSYPGAHSAFSAAASAVLASFFGDHDHIAVTSPMLPGVVRSFDSYSAAALETGLSRIYGGVHTRLDHQAGAQMGQDVAGFVLTQTGSPGFGFR